jgi:hypothetical protein
MPRAEDWALIDGGHFIVLLGNSTIEVRMDSTNDALSSWGHPCFVFVATTQQTVFFICNTLNLAEEVVVAETLADFAMDCSSGWHEAPWNATACCCRVPMAFTAATIFRIALDLALLAADTLCG